MMGDDPFGDIGAWPEDPYRARARQIVQQQARGTTNGHGSRPALIVPPQDEPEHEPYRVNLIDSAAFEQGDYRLSWHVRHVLVRGQPAIMGGPKKCLKTSLLVDLALSVASGRPFLGTFAVDRPVPVALLSGESGEATLQTLARRVALAKEIEWPAVDVYWGFELPQLSLQDQLAALTEATRQHKIGLLIYDPLYLGLLAGVGAEGLSASNLYQIGPLLLAVAKACLAVGCTPVLAHHFKITRKDAYAEPQLEDLAYAGVQEYARQWILLSRREAYDPDNPEGLHKLWLSAGGSAGHSTLRAVDIREGRLLDDFSGRVWEVDVFAPADARASEEDTKTSEEERRQQAKDKADDAKVLAAVDKLDPDRQGVSVTKLRAAASISGDRTRRACWRLVAEEVLEEVTFQKAGGKGAKQTVEGYRRPPKGEENER